MNKVGLSNWKTTTIPVTSQSFINNHNDGKHPEGSLGTRKTSTSCFFGFLCNDNDAFSFSYKMFEL